MATEPGLRERKKIETRQRISDIATAMFIARGFDNVTVAEIAETANVSKMTVFNYFPRKEDLFLDRVPEAVALITDAIHGRREGETPVAALRRMLLDLLRRGHPLGGVGDSFDRFFQVIIDSPALRARVRESAEELESGLATLFAEAEGADPDDPKPRLAAALTVAAWRTAYVSTARRQLAGERGDGLARDHEALLTMGFDAVERALRAG